MLREILHIKFFPSRQRFASPSGSLFSLFCPLRPLIGQTFLRAVPSCHDSLFFFSLPHLNPFAAPHTTHYASDAPAPVPYTPPTTVSRLSSRPYNKPSNDERPLSELRRDNQPLVHSTSRSEPRRSDDGCWDRSWHRQQQQQQSHRAAQKNTRVATMREDDVGGGACGR